MMLSEDLLGDDSPLLAPEAAPTGTLAPAPLALAGDELPTVVAAGTGVSDPLPVIGAGPAPAAAEQGPPPLPPPVTVTFDRAGPLGIEFERLAAPFVVERLHEGGLAFDSGIEVGHRLVTINGEAAEAMVWEDLKHQMLKRPVVCVLQRDPASAQAQKGAALFSGFAGAMRSGLDLGSKLGSSSMDLGSKLGSSGLGGFAGLGGLGGLGSNLLSSVQASVGAVDEPAYIPAAAEVAAPPATAEVTVSSAAEEVTAPPTVAEICAPPAEAEVVPPPGKTDTVPPVTTEVAASPAMPVTEATTNGDQTPAHEAMLEPPDSTASMQAPQHSNGVASPAEPSETTEVVSPPGKTDDMAPPGKTDDMAEPATTEVAASPAVPQVATAMEDWDLPASAEATTDVDQTSTFEAILAPPESTASTQAPQHANGSASLAEASETTAKQSPRVTKVPADVGETRAACEDTVAVAPNGPPTTASGNMADEWVDLALDPAEVAQDSAAEQPPTLTPELDVGLLDEVVGEDVAIGLHAGLEPKQGAELAVDLAAERAVELDAVKLLYGDQIQELRKSLDAAEAARKRAEAEAEARVASAEAQAAAAERKLRESLTTEFNGRAETLAEQHAGEINRERDLLEARFKEESDRTRKELEQIRSTLAEEYAGETKRERAFLEGKLQEQSCSTKQQLDELSSALCQKDQQLADKEDAMNAKDEEIKALLKQLAAVPTDSVAAEARDEAATAAAESPREKEEPTAPTHFEVVFALEGPLGLEFRQQAAPYIVAQVHADRVATGLGINPGDELVLVAGESVTDATTWPMLVKSLSQRPVVAKFRRDPRLLPADQEASLLSSVSSAASAGSSLFTAAARRAGGLAAGNGAAASGAGDSAAAAAATAEVARLQTEVERLGMFLRAKDAAVAELEASQARQRQALQLLEGSGGAGAAEASQLAQEKEGLAQQVTQLQSNLVRVETTVQTLESQREALNKQCQDETRQKEEHRREVGALTERCDSLMMQFDTLKNTCQSLTLDSKQKGELEGQVQELAKMNAQWQQAHQHMSAESESLRLRASEVHQLQAEISRLLQFEENWIPLQTRVRDAEQRLMEANELLARRDEERRHDQEVVQRLQGVLDAVQETGESEAGHLESELLERNRECSSLRREAEDLRKRVEDLVRVQQECQEAADAGRTLRGEAADLREQLEHSKQEQAKLSDVVERCLERMEKDGRERPFLVDKRMVTQMVAAFMEQRDHPRQSQEILARMADLLGFTQVEREQVGLSQKRRTLLEQQDEVTGLSELSDRFVDFLFEESEDG